MNAKSSADDLVEHLKACLHDDLRKISEPSTSSQQFPQQQKQTDSARYSHRSHEVVNVGRNKKSRIGISKGNMWLLLLVGYVLLFIFLPPFRWTILALLFAIFGFL